MSNDKKWENIDIHIIYKPNQNSEEKTIIFGEEFVDNNKDNCIIIYKGEQYELKEYFEDIDNNKYIYIQFITLTLRILKEITDMSHIFNGCTTLYSFPDTLKMDNPANGDINDDNSESSLLSSLFNDPKLNTNYINEINDRNNEGLKNIIKNIIYNKKTNLFRYYCHK